MSKQKVSRLDWHYTRWGGVAAVLLIKIWIKIHRKPHYFVNLIRPIDQNEPTIIASNHQSLLDPPSIFSAFSFGALIKISPVKFMTYHKYYNSKYKPPLYTTGCFPTHGQGHTGVPGAVYFARNGYRSFVFPEGKRIKNNQRTPAYEGIVKILSEIPEARLILVHLDWDKRSSFFSRPDFSVIIHDASKDVDRSNADSIMDAIYSN